MKKLFVLSVLLVFTLALIPSSVVLAVSPACVSSCTTANTYDTVSGAVQCTCGSGVTAATPLQSNRLYCNASDNGGLGAVYGSSADCTNGVNGITQLSTPFTRPASQNPAPGTTGSGLNIDFVKPGLRGIQTQGNLDTIEQLATFVTKIGNYLFTFLMAAAVILIIWGAFDFIAGGGDPKRIETARQKIMWAFVGIAIALLAVFFAPIVRSFLGVSIAP